MKSLLEKANLRKDNTQVISSKKLLSVLQKLEAPKTSTICSGELYIEERVPNLLKLSRDCLRCGENVLEKDGNSYIAAICLRAVVLTLSISRDENEQSLRKSEETTLKLLHHVILKGSSYKTVIHAFYSLGILLRRDSFFSGKTQADFDWFPVPSNTFTTSNKTSTSTKITHDQVCQMVTSSIISYISIVTKHIASSKKDKSEKKCEHYSPFTSPETILDLIQHVLIQWLKKAHDFANKEKHKAQHSGDLIKRIYKACWNFSITIDNTEGERSLDYNLNLRETILKILLLSRTQIETACNIAWKSCALYAQAQQGHSSRKKLEKYHDRVGPLIDDGILEVKLLSEEVQISYIEYCAWRALQTKPKLLHNSCDDENDDYNDKENISILSSDKAGRKNNKNDKNDSLRHNVPPCYTYVLSYRSNKKESSENIQASESILNTIFQIRCIQENINTSYYMPQTTVPKQKGKKLSKTVEQKLALRLWRLVSNLKLNSFVRSNILSSSSCPTTHDVISEEIAILYELVIIPLLSACCGFTDDSNVSLEDVKERLILDYGTTSKSSTPTSPHSNKDNQKYYNVLLSSILTGSTLFDRISNFKEADTLLLKAYAAFVCPASFSLNQDNNIQMISSTCLEISKRRINSSSSQQQQQKKTIIGMSSALTPLLLYCHLLSQQIKFCSDTKKRKFMYAQLSTCYSHIATIVSSKKKVLVVCVAYALSLCYHILSSSSEEDLGKDQHDIIMFTMQILVTGGGSEGNTNKRKNNSSAYSYVHRLIKSLELLSQQEQDDETEHTDSNSNDCDILEHSFLYHLSNKISSSQKLSLSTLLITIFQADPISIKSYGTIVKMLRDEIIPNLLLTQQETEGMGEMKRIVKLAISCAQKVVYEKDDQEKSMVEASIYTTAADTLSFFVKGGEDIALKYVQKARQILLSEEERKESMEEASLSSCVSLARSIALDILYLRLIEEKGEGEGSYNNLLLQMLCKCFKFCKLYKESNIENSTTCCSMIPSLIKLAKNETIIPCLREFLFPFFYKLGFIIPCAITSNLLEELTRRGQVGGSQTGQILVEGQLYSLAQKAQSRQKIFLQGNDIDLLEHHIDSLYIQVQVKPPNDLSLSLQELNQISHSLEEEEEKKHDNKDWLLSTCYLALCEGYHKCGSIWDSLQYAKNIPRICKTVLKKKKPQKRNSAEKWLIRMSFSLNLIGNLYHRLGDRKRSYEYCQAAIQALKQSLDTTCTCANSRIMEYRRSFTRIKSLYFLEGEDKDTAMSKNVNENERDNNLMIQDFDLCDFSFSGIEHDDCDVRLALSYHEKLNYLQDLIYRKYIHHGIL